MAAFGSLYVVGGARILYSVGINSGGPYALWCVQKKNQIDKFSSYSFWSLFYRL